MENSNKKKLYMILAILGGVLLLGGASYAVLTLVLSGDVANKLVLGNLSLDLEETNTITLSNAIPTSDTKGKTEAPMVFSVTNNGTIEAGYKIYVEDAPIDASKTRIDNTLIRYELKENGVQYEIDNLEVNEKEIYIGNIAPNETVDFELRVWVDYDTTTLAGGTTFKSRLRIEASQELIPTTACKDIPSHEGTPTAPELVGDMIPVMYDETQDEWIKVDTSSKDWYDYNEQKWANAVTVTETNRATLVSSAAGTVIPMNDINAMFVWIPRYSYTIANTYGIQGCGGDTASVDTPGAFDIKWIDSNTTELGTAAYTGDTVANWYTNSAFCWGDTCDDPNTRLSPENRELSGIWVGKFETSTSNTTCSASVTSTNCNKLLEPIIKPSVTSWRNVTLSNMFNSVRTYMNSDNGSGIFGLSGSTYDAHMMKNTEWGAVAYLSQSKYGKYGNIAYTGANKEVAINNCSSYVTGIGGDTVSASSSGSTCTTNAYETEKGQAASTTGNIMGVYDMSGGAWEYVMGNMQDASGNFYPSSSGFSSAPEARYYNSYANGSSSSDYTRGMLGDGTKEIADFYNDYNYFVYGSSTWFLRGGGRLNSTSAGVFYFSGDIGNSYSGSAFRVSLVP